MPTSRALTTGSDEVARIAKQPLAVVEGEGLAEYRAACMRNMMAALVVYSITASKSEVNTSHISGK